jgi:hypothetical protein
MNLLFLDTSVARVLALQEVSQKSGRQLNDHWRGLAKDVSQAVAAYRMRPACALGSAAEIITSLYKRTDEYFAGRSFGFSERKALAREAGLLLADKIELVAHSADHFRLAQTLWFDPCRDEVKEAYAQFLDYLDAALIMKPPTGHAISHTVLGHPHVKYILGKKRSPTQVFLFHEPS